MATVRRSLPLPKVSGLWLRIAAALLVFGAMSLAPERLAHEPRATLVWLGNRSFALHGRATVAKLLRLADVQPRAGRLLSLSGRVLDPAAIPAVLVRNGKPVSPEAPLSSGDKVEVSDGADQMEPTAVESYSGSSANPQFLVGGGNVVVRRGLVSGEVELLKASGGGPPVVALTFDDGPDPASTPRVLATLKRWGVAATFFVVGRMAQRHPELVRQELADGMAVGDHTWSHTSLVGKPPEIVRQELQQTRDFLTSLGAHVTVFRPPYGGFDGSVLAEGASLGMRAIIWTVDPGDWRRPGVGVIVRRVLERVRPGAIVLLHDGGGNRSQTVAALPLLLQALRARGYQFVTLS